MDTDQALSIATVVGLFTICMCGIGSVCYKTRIPTGMKHSRSDPDFTAILENAVPSASASRVQTDVQDPNA
jgi:hypothetical protein